MQNSPSGHTAAQHDGPALWTARSALEWTRAHFSRCGIESARLDAELLLAEVLGLTRLGLYLDLDRPLSADERTRYKVLLRRRATREPLSQILGRHEFWGRNFVVSADVLTPRPESETLIEDVLRWAREQTAGTLLDVGAGTGCLAITLALELPEWRVLASDVSLAALRTAARNAKDLGARVHFLAADLLSPLASFPSLNAVVSNPPYLTDAALSGSMPEVRDFEPQIALRGRSPDGLGVHRALANDAAALLVPGGMLWLEIAPDQAVPLCGDLRDLGYDEPTALPDLGGSLRVVRAMRRL